MPAAAAAAAPRRSSATARGGGIRLPKVLLDELNLDGSGRTNSHSRSRPRPTLPTRGRGGGRRQPVDRRQRRALLRQEKKKEKQSRHRQPAHQDTLGHDADDDEDGDDGDDDDDNDDKDGYNDNDDAPTVTVQRLQEAPKSILKKPRKRKGSLRESEEEEAEAVPAAKKRLGKSVRDRLAQDDAEIAYLEKKLKITSKKKKGCQPSLGDETLDFLLAGLKDDYLDDRPERAARENLLAAASAVPSGEGHGSDDGSDSPDAFEGFSDDDGDGDGEADHGRASQARPMPRENPYKPGLSTETGPGVAGQKYVPPSLRKPVSAEAEPEHLARLRRQIRGLVNRLSEARLLPILGEVEELYRAHPRADVTNILTDLLLATLCDPSVLADTYCILHGGFLAGLYRLMGTDVGATVVQRIVEEFLAHHARVSAIADPAVAAAAGKECTNLVSLLAELYNFQVIGCVLVFDLVRLFLAELSELHTELLLRIVRIAGSQLRSDDPAALKSLVQLLQPAIAKAGGLDRLSVRTRFMIETLTNLKNNRLKSSTTQAQANLAVTAEHTVRMKRTLGSLNTRHLRATEPLRASLDDIRSVQTKGKWWLVGASWAGRPAAPPATTTTPSQGGDQERAEVGVEGEGEGGEGEGGEGEGGGGGGEGEGEGEGKSCIPDDGSDGAMPDLVALARQHRMNTDIRRAVFITLLSATDCADAHARLLKLQLKKRTQRREIPRVLLHCAAAEPHHNPYYTLVAKRLCAAGHPLRMTFTFMLWDYFRRFGEAGGAGRGGGDNDEGEDRSDDDGDEAGGWKKPAGLRKIVNLAKLYAALVADGSLALAVFKTLANWAHLQPATRRFLEVFFAALLAEARGDDSVRRVFGGAFTENASLVRGVLYFLRKKMKPAAGLVDGRSSEGEAVRRGVMCAIRVLEDTLQREV